VSRPIPDHGTRACYLRGCPRPECSAAHRAYCKQYRNKAYQHGALRDDASQAATHCRKLSAQGWSERQIADAAKCSPRLVHNLITGAQANVNPGITAKILAARPSASHASGKTYVDSTGTVRRGQALVAIGYQIKDIAAALGMSADPLSHTLHGQRKLVRAYTAQRMTAIYDTWSQQSGPSQRARQFAHRHGWHGPAAWDDIDDPNEQPEGDLPNAELDRFEEAKRRRDEVLLLADAGVLKAEIAARVGISQCRIEEILREHRPVLVRQIKALSDAERGNHMRRRAA
jgi:transcriptional regulator with XRE-family HTH domain